MYLDNQLRLADSIDIGVTVQTVYSTNGYDLGSVVGDPGNGEDLYVHFIFDELIVSGGAATVQCIIFEDAAVPIDASSVILLETRAITYSDITLGKIISIALPVGLITKQFIGAGVAIAGATTTAGTVSIVIGPEKMQNP